MSYRLPIVATDLSEGAEAVLRALPLLIDKGVRGTIAHVIEAPDLPPHLPERALEDWEVQVRRDRRKMESTLAAWAETRGLPGWDAVVEHGRIGPTLARIAKERHADLIGVGSHGAGRIARAILGSAARSVLRHATIDTLIARDEHARMDRILIATDFQEPSEVALRRARAIALQNRSSVTLVHAIDPNIFAGAFYPTPPEGRFNAVWLKEYVLDGLAKLNQEYFDGRADVLCLEGRAKSAIVGQAATAEADLVVVGSHGGGAVSRFLLGSVAEGIATEAPCSVLVARS